MQRRLQPPARAHFALIAQAMIVRPSSLLHHQGHGFFNLLLIGVALFDHRHRYAVRAEDQRHRSRMGKTGERIVDPLHYGCDVCRITIKRRHTGNRNCPLPPALPLVQTAARRRTRVLRIQRQQHDLVYLSILQLSDRFGGEWVPVAHRDHAARVDAVAHQACLERSGLLLSEPANRRAANGRVMLSRFFRARLGDDLRQRTPAQARKRKVDNVGIAEEVIKEGFDCRERFRSTELEKDYPNTFRNPSHSHRSPGCAHDVTHKPPRSSIARSQLETRAARAMRAHRLRHFATTALLCRRIFHERSSTTRWRELLFAIVIKVVN